MIVTVEPLAVMVQFAGSLNVMLAGEVKLMEPLPDAIASEKVMTIDALQETEAAPVAGVIDETVGGVVSGRAAVSK